MIYYSVLSNEKGAELGGLVLPFHFPTMSAYCYGQWLTQLSDIKANSSSVPFLQVRFACCLAPYIRPILLLPKSELSSPSGSLLDNNTWVPFALTLLLSSLLSDRHVFITCQHEGSPHPALEDVK